MFHCAISFLEEQKMITKLSQFQEYLQLDLQKLEKKISFFRIIIWPNFNFS